MARVSSEQGNQDSQSDQFYEQQWQEYIAYETRARLALEEQQKEEEAQSYLYEINLSDRGFVPVAKWCRT
ncbi:hypothetical protein [Fibrella forsythiae]|uniref:Uncharacterized protein n=1 Tax=Fibrella forsythiae TaxID=2817061 RepID=A0ABS3JMR8_9BACT|nr:hypothetical protein [Fibrella forsythiae]MBO0951297.1 hypothetical protein [Fibrella forsythiae]